MFKSKAMMSAMALCGSAACIGAGAQEVTYFPADLDRNGYVSAQEWGEYQEMTGSPAQMGESAITGSTVAQPGMPQTASRPRAEVSYWRADYNRNGYVSNEEWQQYRSRLEQRMRGEAAPGPALSDTPGVIEGVPPAEAGEFTYWQADADRDGYVSNEEWEQFRLELEQEHR